MTPAYRLKSNWQRIIHGFILGFNREKYFNRRAKVIDPKSQLFILLKIYYLYWIKRVDGKKNCSFGTYLNSGAQFVTPPYLPHGPGGIIVGGDASIGRECIIYHQVTIAGGGVVVGDYVEIGAGAKILPNVKIGNHAKVGANCVVVENIPDYATVVLQKPRIIIK